MDNPKVIIIILNYNRHIEEVDCVKSILKSTDLPIRIIVVENGADDSVSTSIFKNYHNVEIIKSPTNLGFAGGMNLGIKHAMNLSPKYIFIANSDTLIQSKAIDILVDSLDENPSAAMASGTIFYHPQIDKVWYAGGNIDYFRASGFQNTKIDTDNDHSPKSITFISGCACLIRTQALLDVGLFDERFFLYLEDTELSARMVQKGYKIMYVPQATIYHRLNDAKYPKHLIYYGIRNRFLFIETCSKGLQKIAGFLYLFVVVLMKLIYWRIFHQEYYHAAYSGAEDYFSRHFSKGRGLRPFPTIPLNKGL
jgi:GT2 family glycosyltransferase